MFIAGTSSVWADNNPPHSAAPTFSDPDSLAVVEKDWKNKPFKHDKMHKDADLVVALSQQSYPIFHELILEYAEKKQLN